RTRIAIVSLAPLLGARAVIVITLSFTSVSSPVLFLSLKLFGEGSSRMDPALLDDIIGRLMEVKERKPGKKAHLKEAEIRQLCAASKDIFLRQPNLLEIEVPIKICGNC
ncbi:hypothetical protein GW17_00054315, partial [Ensete ventricosum]